MNEPSRDAGHLTVDIRVDAGAFRLDASVAVAAGRTTAVLGPNGAGKSTLLRAVAGLQPVTEGRITLGATVLDDAERRTWVPPEQRPVGFVFQDHELFPHLDALDNVAFGLRARGATRRAARARAMGWLERVGLADAAALKPAQLSGGQSQRVALARALAIEPEVLLLDEPLSALDATSRYEIRHELRRHLDEFEGIRLVVSHDPVDTAVLADEVVVIEGGQVVQRGTPSDLTARPRTPWVASLGGTNLYSGRIDRSGRALQIDGGAGTLVLGSPAPLGAPLLAAVAPNSVTLSTARPEGSMRNVWPGRVTTMEPLAGRLRVRVAGRPTVVAEITVAAAEELRLATGSDVWVAVKATEIVTYPR